MAELARLAYEASLRRLEKQDQSLTEIRSRTGLLLAASSLAASFLGRPALDADPVAVAIAALGAFAVSIGASVYVLMPKQDLVFSLVGSRVFEEFYEFQNDLAEVHRRLAYDLDRFWEQNDVRGQRLVRAFRLAAWALVAEVLLLLFSVSGTLG
jgi:hypothetical protein